MQTEERSLKNERYLPCFSYSCQLHSKIKQSQPRLKMWGWNDGGQSKKWAELTTRTPTEGKCPFSSRTVPHTSIALRMSSPSRCSLGIYNPVSKGGRSRVHDVHFTQGQQLTAWLNWQEDWKLSLFSDSAALNWRSCAQWWGSRCHRSHRWAHFCSSPGFQKRHFVLIHPPFPNLGNYMKHTLTLLPGAMPS